MVAHQTSNYMIHISVVCLRTSRVICVLALWQWHDRISEPLVMVYKSEALRDSYSRVQHSHLPTETTASALYTIPPLPDITPTTIGIMTNILLY